MSIYDWMFSFKNRVKQMLDQKANISHTHKCVDITDLTTVTQTKANWNESNPESLAFIQNKPSLFSGSYSDLAGKPTLFSGSYTDLSSKPTLFDGNYTSLSNKPSLFDGNYNSLSNKPTIPAAQVQSDWNAVSGLSQIANKPSLAAVATSGSYNDLSNKPTIPSAFSMTINNTVSRAISASPTAWQVSSTKPSSVKYTVQLAAVVTLNATVFLEISSNNSTWVEVTRFAANLGLLATLNNQMIADVPAGWYVRLRSSITVGAASYLVGQETIYN